MNTDMTVFTNGNTTSKTLVSGARVNAVLSRKAYKEKHSLTNQETKRRYPAYLIEMGVNANGNIAAMIGSNQIFAQKVKKDEKGFVVTFIRADDERFVTPADKVNAAAKLSAAEAKLAAAEARIAELEKLATV